MIQKPVDFYKQLCVNFPFLATEKQDLLLKLLSIFIFETNKESLFLLKGYAGTGKTTTISTFVNALKFAGKKAVLLAPTGRAAKVISVYSKRPAFTIHKKIYFPKKQLNASISFVLQPNKHTNTIFIVDEASMIPDEKQHQNSFETTSLLDDLISYVYSGQNCKLLFIGDTAQLPPVKLNVSPALDSDILTRHYFKDVKEIELDEVMRQHENSGILFNATQLRKLIQNDGNPFQFEVKFPDIKRLEDGYDIEDAILDAYNSNGVEDTAFIVRSNKRANEYNQQIRMQIRGQENTISAGDYIMVVKNNYFWLDETSPAGFIANGDIGKITRVKNIHEMYGFRFADVQIHFEDIDQEPISCKVMLDTLYVESSNLPYDRQKVLFDEIIKDYEHLSTKRAKMEEMRKNPYFNAIQIKFAYAVTCHKAQGGQWNVVFIDQGYLTEEMLNTELLRWLYTATTRATKELFFVNFNKLFFN